MGQKVVDPGAESATESGVPWSMDTKRMPISVHSIINI